MDIFLLIIAFVVPYLLGSVNFSIVFSKAFKGDDIRNSGSGNAGATNMLRTYGKKLAILTLVLDILKGVVSVLFGTLLTFLVSNYVVSVGNEGIAVSHSVFARIQEQLPFYRYLSAVGVILGHNFPLYFGFKGGKGVATSLGTILTLNWQVGLIAVVFALAIMAVTRYVSLGSVMGAVIFVAVDLSYMIFTNGFSGGILVFDIIIAALLILRHHQNIKRLINGTENKLGSKKEGK